MKTVRNGDATIAYRAEGDGPSVVLIASTGRGTAEFDDLSSLLCARGFRVLRPEPRGIGASTGPIAGVSFHDFARDIAAVVRNESDATAIVAGHAFGNWIARTFAADHPDLARGVVLIAAAARHAPAELTAIVSAICDSATPEAVRLAGLRHAFFAAGHDPRGWLEGWHPAVLASQRAARRLTDDAHWRGAGAAPILDLQAELDPFRPPATRGELHDELGDRVTVRLIADASHALPVEQPEAVADAIAGWAKGLPARP